MAPTTGYSRALRRATVGTAATIGIAAALALPATAAQAHGVLTDTTPVAVGEPTPGATPTAAPKKPDLFEWWARDSKPDLDEWLQKGGKKVIGDRPIPQPDDGPGTMPVEPTPTAAPTVQPTAAPTPTTPSRPDTPVVKPKPGGGGLLGGLFSFFQPILGLITGLLGSLFGG